MYYSAGDTLLTDVCYIKSHDEDGQGDGRRVGILLLLITCVWCRCWPEFLPCSLLATETEVISHSLSVHPSLFIVLSHAFKSS